MPFASELVVMLGAGGGAAASVVIVNALVAVWPALVTSTSKFVVPAAVGVPLISPVAVFSTRPAGSVVALNRAHV